MRAQPHSQTLTVTATSTSNSLNRTNTRNSGNNSFTASVIELGKDRAWGDLQRPNTADICQYEMNNNKVRVLVRTRPTAKFAHDMINLEAGGKMIDVHCKRDSKGGYVNNQVLDWSFQLDGILHNATQDYVHQTVSKEFVTNALDGYNGTLLCYGQTGAGKTYTMTGVAEIYKHRGIIPHSISQIYQEIEQRADSAITIRISYLEIYNEAMFDLLAALPETRASVGVPHLNVVEEGGAVHVKGLSCHLAQNEEEALNLLFEGETNRAIAEHQLNNNSSRSHCIFTVYIENRSRVESNARFTRSKLHFVDLAGSERLSKTHSEGRVQKEAMYINKSLTFLEQIVIALAEKNRDHVPFRQSKLTHCLKDSIGGTSNTLLIANIWGEATQIEETISTLRFASRMMRVKMEPMVQQHFDPTIMVGKLEREIKILKRELAMHDTLVNRSQMSYDALSAQQRYEVRQQVQKFLDGDLDEIDILNVRQIQGVYDSFKDIHDELERDVEDRIRAKFMLIDKSDHTSIAIAQHSVQSELAVTDGDIADDVTINSEEAPMLVEDQELVGESDRATFGIGPAPSTAKPVLSSLVSVKKKDKERRGKSKERLSPAQKLGSPVQSQRGALEGSTSGTPSNEKQEREEMGTPSSIVVGSPSKLAQPTRPSTPPPRSEAFEDFKKLGGTEINRILNENKEIHAGKKKAYADLARQLNITKEQLDESRAQLENLRKARENQGQALNEDGDLIISEEEYMEIQRLKDLKVVYRADFDELKNLKSEVMYCQKLVEQTRRRLVTEFDNWYAQSFLSDVDPQTSAAAGFGVRAGVAIPQKAVNVGVEDEQEKFNRLQMNLLLENPEGIAFYNAKLQTSRRKTYETAMSQPQPNLTRKSGTPIRVVRNSPPTQLQIH